MRPLYLVPLLPLLILAAAAPSPTTPILRRTDRPDSLYRALGARYADILAHVDNRDEGIVLRPRWVLTAAHVVETTGAFDQLAVTIRSERYRVEKIIIHPDWEGNWDALLSNHDLALLKLDRPVATLRPIRLYRGSDEQGQVVTILGRGKTGTSETGPVGKKGTIVRGATNRIDGVSATALLTVFDAQEYATDLEGSAGAGDSGGPALLERNDTLYLVGVGSAGTWATGHSGYGTLDIYGRVSAFADWITETMDADPPPTIDWSPPVPLDATPAWPATPVGRLAAAFFEAYAGGKSAIEAFHATHGDPGDDHAAWATRVYEGLVTRLGTHLEMHSLATAGPHMIQVMVHSPTHDVWKTIGLNTAPKPPYLLARLYLKNEAPPR